jgi:hypothetical protein
MKTLFDNKYLKVKQDENQKILEVTGKKDCGDLIKLKQIILIIEQYYKDTHSSKLIFKLEGLNTIYDEKLISDELLPYLGYLGVKNIAIITGKDKKTKVFFEELGNYLNPTKKQYRIKTKSFETKNDCLEWLKN